MPLLLSVEITWELFFYSLLLVCESRMDPKHTDIRAICINLSQWKLIQKIVYNGEVYLTAAIHHSLYTELLENKQHVCKADSRCAVNIFSSDGISKCWSQSPGKISIWIRNCHKSVSSALPQSLTLSLITQSSPLQHGDHIS